MNAHHKRRQKCKDNNQQMYTYQISACNQLLIYHDSTALNCPALKVRVIHGGVNYSPIPVLRLLLQAVANKTAESGLNG